MCVVSMIGDDWSDRWKKRYPEYQPWDWKEITPPVVPNTQVLDFEKELNKLKEEVKILKEQLKRAKQYDIDNNEPDCEIDEKMEKLRKVAELVDIDLNDVLKNGT